MLATFLKGASAAGGLEFVGGVALSSADTQSPADTGTPSYSLTGLTGGLASAPAIGDIVIACVAFNNGTDRNIQCTTSGYTEVADLYHNSNNDAQLGVYYKVLTSADTSVAFNLGVNVRSVFCALVWRNINATPLDATTTTATNTRTRADPPAITTVTNNAVVIAVGATAIRGDEVLAFTAGPSGMTNFYTSQTATNSVPASSIGIASVVVPIAGSYDPGIFATTGSSATSTANSWCAATLALRPK
jgi:hypothetical protein